MTLRATTATCAVEAGNQLGEGILWCPRRQCLYWTDIQASILYRHTPATGETRRWHLFERPACLALCEDDDWLLLGLASQLAFLHLPSGHVHTIRDVEPDLPTRLNDGACDREGRFVFGTMHEPADGGPKQPLGSFYRLDADLSLHRLDLEQAAIPNSIAFSPDGRTMYFCDSPRKAIWRCTYDMHGETASAREWIDLRDMAGEPDGSTVDADGGLWNAHWGMGRVVRHAADGSVDMTVEVPARQPSRAALGGPDLRTLYITSARDGMSPDELRNDPQAGHLFAAATAIPGLAEPRFAGIPPTTIPPPASVSGETA